MFIGINYIDDFMMLFLFKYFLDQQKKINFQNGRHCDLYIFFCFGLLFVVVRLPILNKYTTGNYIFISLIFSECPVR